MLHLTYKSIPQYSSSNLCGYQFLKQEISYSLFLLYTFLYNQYEFFVMNFIILILPKFRTKLLAANHFISLGRTKFDTEKKSLKFQTEIITLLSSANKWF